MNSFEKLLLENKAWAYETQLEDPGFFDRLSKGQTPEFLWIGCSDSRVPANMITNTQPGEIFVHRNIANLVVENDINLLSVLEYAVIHLKVKHVIVCGHYGCGGVKAALGNESLGLLDQWLVNIKNTYQDNRSVIDSVTDPEAKVNLLSEFSVRQQVINLSKTDTIRRAWEKGARPHIHGWVYGLKDGLLKPVYDIAPQVKEPAYAIL
ncbi:carbonic anhydrase [Paraflavitalea speifideaquila]|uniref:carbonic anhydrase n=1 Tax=Paraflavitalea speifideaquila TaxID=3076558 RepID=UPI0028EF42B8|nr:carbonic anhydrase [Paraflavitalea speifideiaquila]